MSMPCSAAASDAGSSTSPPTTSVVELTRPRNASGRRVRQRTRTPRCSNFDSSRPPTYPVAPVSNTNPRTSCPIANLRVPAGTTFIQRRREVGPIGPVLRIHGSFPVRLEEVRAIRTTGRKSNSPPPLMQSSDGRCEPRSVSERAESGSGPAQFPSELNSCLGNITAVKLCLRPFLWGGRAA